MTIQYKLLANFQGINQSNLPIFCDVGTSFDITFTRQGKKLEKLVVKLIEQTGKEHTFSVVDKLKLPEQLNRPTIYKIFVYEYENDCIINRWECEPLVLRSFNDLTNARISIENDLLWLTDSIKGIIEQYSDILYTNKELLVENAEIKSELARLTTNIKAEISEDLASLTEYKRLNGEAIQQVVHSLNALTDTVDKIITENSL